MAHKMYHKLGFHQALFTPSPFTPSALPPLPWSLIFPSFCQSQSQRSRQEQAHPIGAKSAWRRGHMVD